MCDEIEVCELNPCYNLREEESGLSFIDGVLIDILDEFSSVGEFHNHVDMCGRIQNFVEFDDMWMFDEFKYFDLSFDLFRQKGTFDIIFLFFIRSLFIILTATRSPVN